MRFKCPSCHNKFYANISSSAFRLLPQCPKCSMAVNEDDEYVGVLCRVWSWLFTKKKVFTKSEQKADSEQPFNGRVYGVRVLNRALSAGEVADRLVHGDPPPVYGPSALESVMAELRYPFRFKQAQTMEELNRQFLEIAAHPMASTRADAYGNLSPASYPERVPQPILDEEPEEIKVCIHGREMLISGWYNLASDALMIKVRTYDATGKKRGMMYRVTHEMLAATKIPFPRWYSALHIVSVNHGVGYAVDPVDSCIWVHRYCPVDCGCADIEIVTRFPIDKLEEIPPGAEYPIYNDAF